MKIIIEVSDKIFNYATTLAEMTIGNDIPEEKMKAIIDSLKDDEIKLDPNFMGDKKTAQQMIYGFVLYAIGQRAEELEKESKG